MRALVGHLVFGPEAFDQRERFFHSIDADLRRVVGNSELTVIPGVPARAKPELEPATGEEVERRRLLREHHRIAVVVVEHEATDPERGRRRRGRGEGSDRGELRGDVIGHEQGVVAEGLSPPRRVTPVLGGPAALGHDRETERTHRGR